ncbi:MAG TPA: hypothetical protein VNK23_09750 [Candidatus Dormibacteraeota bacterium]|nr:hypothetical protein [Candidatus Dormibacteraeota bacterium]
MPKLVSIVGFIVMCAGIDLLWQSRMDIRYWFAAYRSILRELWRRRDVSRLIASARKRQGAVGVLLGMSFVFLVGPVLILTGVALMLLLPRF